MDFPGGLDFKLGPIVASFFGAMAYAVVLKVRHPWDFAGIVIVGVGTSIYMGPFIAEEISQIGFAHMPADSLQNAAGFIAGLGGMAICNGVLVTIRKITNRSEKEVQ